MSPKNVTTAEFNACLNALTTKTGGVSRHISDTVFQGLPGAEKVNGNWRITLDVFWKYVNDHYKMVLEKRGITDATQLIEHYTGDYVEGGKNYLRT